MEQSMERGTEETTERYSKLVTFFIRDNRLEELANAVKDRGLL